MFSSPFYFSPAEHYIAGGVMQNVYSMQKVLP